MKFLLSLLLVPSILDATAATAAAAAPVADTLKLTSKDKKEFTVDRAAAIATSGLIKTALENDDKAEEVPIPGVTGAILGPITKLMPFVSEQQEKQLKSDVQALPSAQLMDLLQAANYMDAPVLVRAFAGAVAEQLNQLAFKKPDGRVIYLTGDKLQDALNDRGIPPFVSIPPVLLRIISQEFLNQYKFSIDEMLGIKNTKK